MAEVTTFNAFADEPQVVDAQAQSERLGTITHDAFQDDPALLFEQETTDRLDAIAASLGDLTVPELVAA